MQHFGKLYTLPRQEFNRNKTLLDRRVHLLLGHHAANGQSPLASRTNLLLSTLYSHPTYIKIGRYSLHLGNVKEESWVSDLFRPRIKAAIDLIIVTSVLFLGKSEHNAVFLV